MIAEAYKYGLGLVQGALTGLRLSNTNALVNANAHGFYWEAARQGNTWGLVTAVAGVTVAAANVYSAANAQPLVGIANPSSSGYNCVILLGRTCWASGTAAASGLVWAACPANNLVTAVGGNGAVNSLTQAAGGSRARTFINAAMTGITGNAVVAYAGGPTTGALAANANQSFFDPVDGLICIPPGSAGGLFAAAAGTSPIIAASMFWEEVPV